MKISTLEFNHYRSARHVEIDLDPNLNVFVGINGAGKTTVLDAAALMLSWAIARVESPESSGNELPENDILNSKTYAHIALTCRVPGLVGENTLCWRLVQARRGRNANEAHHRALKSDFSLLDSWADEIRHNIGATEGLHNIPVIVYYPINRVVMDIPLGIRTAHSFDLLEAYDKALAGGTSFRSFFEWYRNREDLENESRAEAAGFQSDPQLDAVRGAISRFLPDIKAISVKRDPLRMEVDWQGERLRVEQMSNGEKCLFAMIGDLARRLSIANPTLDNPLDGAGVVLIDEIDLHLHPAWQREVIPKLRETFPNCQFLLTTHSPQVITHVKPDDYLFLLSRGTWGLEVRRAPEHYGKTADRVLEDLMGLGTTRPTEIAARLSAIYELIDQNKVEDAKRAIAILKEEIGEDSELVRAGVLIKRMELIGK